MTCFGPGYWPNAIALITSPETPKENFTHQMKYALDYNCELIVTKLNLPFWVRVDISCRVEFPPNMSASHFICHHLSLLRG